MHDLIGNRVVVCDPTGYMIEGDLDRIEHDRALGWAVLSAARQVNHVNMEESPPSVDAWEIPGVMRVALHLIVRIHLTHLGGEAGASKITRGPTAKRRKSSVSS